MRSRIVLPPTSSNALLTPPRRVARPPAKINAVRFEISRARPRGAQAARVRRVPHWPQNAWAAGFSVAQDGHVLSAGAAGIATSTTGAGLVSVAPHEEQNLFAAGLAVSHAVHTTGGAGGGAGAVGTAALWGSSCTAVRNSRTDLPTAPPTCDNRPAPKMITRMIRMTTISQGPKGTSRSFL
jgi:hypothetical protein